MTDSRTIRKQPGLVGHISLPGDKSIAHRCALFASLGDGPSRIVNFPASEDPQSTLDCVRALGIEVRSEDDGILVVEGRGLDGWRVCPGHLDCGNSGTTMRLMAGLLAGRSFDTRLRGDASLESRPMQRISNPLTEMGASIHLTNGRAPMSIRGRRLRGMDYRLPIASAQVKSAVLLAGIYASGETSIVEPAPSRDHTERMLGLDILEVGGERRILVSEGHPIPAQTWAVPADFSAAAFFIVAATVIPDSMLKLFGVGINDTRTGLLKILSAMGADIVVTNRRTLGGEPIADLAVRSAALAGISVGGDIIPSLIDEIPALAVAACFAEGETIISDAAELRVKETDRIDAMTAGLRGLGAAIEERPDGMIIQGGPALRGATVEARDDHRVAMALAIAGLGASGETTIRGASVAAVSFPGFWDELAAVTL